MKLYVIVNEENQFFAGISMGLRQPVWCGSYYGSATVDIFTNKSLADAWVFELATRHHTVATVKEFTSCH